MDSRLTPSSARSFGQEIVRSPGTRTNRKSSSPRRTTRVFTTSAGVTPRACAASARLRTGPWLIRRCGRAEAARASSAGLDMIQYLLPAAPKRARTAGSLLVERAEHAQAAASVLGFHDPA